MRRPSWFQSILGMLAIVLALPANAQTLVQTETTPSGAVSTRAADLLITPRVGVSHSTSGGGYDGFTSFQGFIPLHQTPGNNLLYLVGQLLLDNDANLGGNLLVGYRMYNPGADRIYGGYLAYDNRDTRYSNFSQIGFGLETLGDAWDARLNAYVPVGDTRQLVGDRLFDTGVQISSLRFRNNFLLASGTRQQQRIRDFEAAMAGFDVEAGGRLLRFPTGDLRAYAGLYYLSAGESAVGVRGRLEARPTDNLTVGFGVQHDRIFGTNVVATVALTLPGARPRGATPASVLARMGEYPGRSYAIVVDRQRDIQVSSASFTEQPVRNPATDEPYVFQHVILGNAGGNGTFENPFGLVQLALDATTSDGNSIVYVQAGTNSGIRDFTIPNGVQVLSTAPTQPLNTHLGVLTLPLSGSGVFPAVTGTVTMGSDTVLSGFSITSATGAGVTFSNVNQVEVRDNFIQNTADAGILGNEAVIVNLFRNEITRTQNQGIYVRNVGTANVTDNQITNTIAGNTTITNPITNDITIGPITIPNPGSVIPLRSGQGIVIATTTGDVNIARNTVTGTGTQGIVLLNANGNAVITDNSVTNTVGNNFTAAVPPIGNITVATGQGIVVAGIDGSLDVSRNTVDAVRGQGIAIAGATNGTTTVSNNIVRNTLYQGMVIAGTSGTTNIVNNQISDVAAQNITATVPILGNIAFATGQGLIVLNSVGTVNIADNTIERVAGAFANPAPASGQGIAIANFAGQVDLNLTNNTIRDTFNDGILIGLAGRPTGTTTAATADITISGNTIERIGGGNPTRGDGIGIGLEQDAVVTNLLIENNVIRNNGDDGIDLRLGLNSATQGSQSTAQLTGVIRNNQITNSDEQGIELQTYLNTRADLTLENNTITRSRAAAVFPAVRLQTFQGGQISAIVESNTLNNTPGNPGVLAQTNLQLGFTGQRLCINLSDNTSPTGYVLASGPDATIREVTGTTNQSGTITRNIPTTPVPSCP